VKSARFLAALALPLLAAATTPSLAADLCANKTPGTIHFFNQEIDRDKPLPAPATELNFKSDIFALACLTDAVGPQAAGGKTFRVVMYVNGKQFGGVFRPALSKSRKDIIIALKEDFGDSMSYMLDSGTYTVRLQAASEKPTGKLDVTLDFKNDVAYIQRLREAGYLADGQIAMKK
jgi:hypothetical protein